MTATDVPLPGFTAPHIAATAAPTTSSEPTTDDRAEWVVVQCDVCGESFEGPANGRGSAVFLRGRHMYAKHRDKSTSKPGRKKAGAPTADDLEARPVLSMLRGAASEVGGTGKPTGEQLGTALGRALQLGSGFVTSLIIETDPTIPQTAEGEAERSNLFNALTLEGDTATQIMQPIGKMLGGTSLNAKYGRQAVDNVEVIASIADLATLAFRWRQYLRLRAQGVAQMRGEQPATAYAEPASQPAPMPAPPSPADVPQSQRTTPAPMAGVVIGPGDVERIRAEQQRKAAQRA